VLYISISDFADEGHEAGRSSPARGSWQIRYLKIRKSARLRCGQVGYSIDNWRVGEWSITPSPFSK
jgi:hypothetical protein